MTYGLKQFLALTEATVAIPDELASGDIRIRTSRRQIVISVNRPPCPTVPPPFEEHNRARPDMLFTRYLLAFKIILTIAGIYWCVVIFQRRHDDIATIRESDVPEDRYVVYGFWAATVVILILLVAFGIPSLVDCYRMAVDW